MRASRHDRRASASLFCPSQPTFLPYSCVCWPYLRLKVDGGRANQIAFIVCLLHRLHRLVAHHGGRRSLYSDCEGEQQRRRAIIELVGPTINHEELTMQVAAYPSWLVVLQPCGCGQCAAGNPCCWRQSSPKAALDVVGVQLNSKQGMVHP